MVLNGNFQKAKAQPGLGCNCNINIKKKKKTQPKTTTYPTNRNGCCREDLNKGGKGKFFLNLSYRGAVKGRFPCPTTNVFYMRAAGPLTFDLSSLQDQVVTQDLVILSLSFFSCIFNTPTKRTKCLIKA